MIQTTHNNKKKHSAGTKGKWKFNQGHQVVLTINGQSNERFSSASETEYLIKSCLDCARCATRFRHWIFASRNPSFVWFHFLSAIRFVFGKVFSFRRRDKWKKPAIIKTDYWAWGMNDDNTEIIKLCFVRFFVTFSLLSMMISRLCSLPLLFCLSLITLNLNS